AALAVVALVPALRPITLRPSAPPATTRTKGGGEVQLEIYVARRGGAVEPLWDGARARPGEALGFGVPTRRDAYVGVVGLGGGGAVNACGPLGSLLVRARAGEPLLLEGSVVLDGVLGRERVIAFACAAPLETVRLVAAVRDRSAL